ncbi:TonB-like protein [Dysgonomonas alginatilytica]|uniref:TonB-like protein n=1 Tax=Dysgonomonas alginatilytica TaxID=1605892 RepID=A0A2V3PN40_9BACT|nr:energy transducer TonB [Dysgonomonas alginatilytica]PXV63832.1 TonB-like protein [Dysgonomonas alginatilytica]
MGRFLSLFCFLFVFSLQGKAQQDVLPDSLKRSEIYLAWNDDSALRDSLEIKKIIPHYHESRYVERHVEYGIVKKLLSVRKLSRFQKGDEARFMFLFNDPNFEPSGTRTVAAISFQGDDALFELMDEMKYITLNTKYRPLINAEFMPSFNGGYNAMMKYLNEKVRLPEDLVMPESCGAVMLGFVVVKDGSVKNLKVIEGCNDILDKEAFRLVKSMPKWQAGKQAGAPVSVFVVLQLIFKR